MAKLIYKYRAWDKYTKLMLKNHELYFNDPELFNDPFDCMPNCGKTEQDDEDNFNRYSSVPEALALFKLLEPWAIAETAKQIQKFIRRLGIVCFSKICDSILMWSHYADYHRGVCFGFDKDLLEAEDLIISDVCYLSRPPLFNVASRRYKFSDQCLNVLFCKSKAWSYEKEIRAVKCPFFTDEIKRKHKFPKAALKEVIFGAKVSEEDLIVISDMCIRYGYDVKFYKMLLDKKGRYNLIKYPVRIAFADVPAGYVLPENPDAEMKIGKMTVTKYLGNKVDLSQFDGLKEM